MGLNICLDEDFVETPSCARLIPPPMPEHPHGREKKKNDPNTLIEGRTTATQ